jgi:hypothetical protein
MFCLCKFSIHVGLTCLSKTPSRSIEWIRTKYKMIDNIKINASSILAFWASTGGSPPLFDLLNFSVLLCLLLFADCQTLSYLINLRCKFLNLNMHAKYVLKAEYLIDPQWATHLYDLCWCHSTFTADCRLSFTTLLNELNVGFLVILLLNQEIHFLLLTILTSVIFVLKEWIVSF